MRRSSEPDERAQFTVAELLARYGEPAPSTGRRHRRAAEDAGTVANFAAQSMIEQNRIDSSELTLRPSEPLPVTNPPERYGASQGDLSQGDSLHRNSLQPNLFQSHFNSRGGRDWAPAVGPSSGATGRAPVTPPVAARPAPVTPPVAARPAPLTSQAPLTRTALSDDPVTDQLPRLDPMPANPAPWSSRRPDSAHPASAEAPAGLGTATRAVPDENKPAVEEDQAQESGSPLWEWVVMVSQIGIGVVGGAALWLICEWLWQQIPVIALVVALAVITALVWVVRRVRRAEDLQTTVIAVLVGLFVTVSPAALLLVGR
ncbi:MAG: hypothetical protein M3460_08110 [Actinomycetota bacterium]|nr:hypothetical protein [Actinomycetota bacterium]